MALNDYMSLDHELAAKGYLSLRKALTWLKCYHPERLVSYPTALRMLEKGQLQGLRVGGHWRLDRAELTRYVTHGNADPQ